jgi:hypothetical protein
MFVLESSVTRNGVRRRVNPFRGFILALSRLCFLLSFYRRRLWMKFPDMPVDEVVAREQTLAIGTRKWLLFPISGSASSTRTYEIVHALVDVLLV